MFISVAKGHYIRSTRVVALMPSHTRPGQDVMSAAKKDGRIVNLRGGTVKVKTLAILDDGQIALLPLAPSRAAARLNEGLAQMPDTTPRRGREYFDQRDVDKEDVSLALDTDLPVGKSLKGG